MKMVKIEKKNIKKLFIIGIMLLSVCLIYSGCGKNPLAHLVNNAVESANVKRDELEKQSYRDALDSFFSALDSGDKNAVAAVFSKNAQQNANFETQLDELMQTYTGPTDADGWDGLLEGEYSQDYGDHASYVEAVFPVRSGEVYNWFWIQVAYENDTDENELGITGVSLYSANYYCACRYDDADKYLQEGDVIGVFDCPMDSEVRSIGGYAYKYTPGNLIDEQEVRQFIEQSDSYSEFKKKFGEPNASNIYYEYELPKVDGKPRYLDIGVIEETDSIYSINVVDDFSTIDRIWNNKDKS